MKRLAALSQNFLRSPQLVKELLGHTNITHGDIVYDIGAGSGVVASALAPRVRSVVAVEIDPRLAEKLRSNLAHLDNVVVNNADFMTLPLSHTPYKVFANIPFSLSAQIVHRLTDAPYPPSAIYLIVQEQFARKLLPDNKGYTNQLAIMLGAEFAARVRRRLKPTDFYPRPNVPTVLLEIVKRTDPLIKKTNLPMFKQFVAGCFADPRKLFRSPLRDIGLSPVAAPSSLTLKQWVALFDLICREPQKQGMSLVEPTDQILNQIASPVAPPEFTSPHLRFIADRMLELAAGKGHDVKDSRQMVGLAAPQLGVSKRIIAIDVTATGTKQKQTLKILVNPTIVWKSKETVLGREGCWSCGNICGAVERAQKVRIEALDTAGKSVNILFTDFVARIAQHEIDHLDGIRFPDRITDSTKLHWVEPAEFERYRTHWQTWRRICPRATWDAMKIGKGDYLIRMTTSSSV